MASFIKEFIDLRSGQEDKDITLENVKSNVTFRGANLWILVCAILIASIGLNVNSTAILIGAMLISPLMGPIIGAGFALGIYDFGLLKRSLKNLAIATIVGICVSGIYFAISPFKEVQSELLARTSPNFFDILIAIFGGLVGVIAMTRVQKGNPLPGLAIATALMPPLCTIGYGLANGNMGFFFGALYLYLINGVFICISTFLIVKYLKYPLKHDIDELQQKKIRSYITVITTVLIIPSLWFAYSLYEKESFITRANAFLDQEFTQKGDILFYKKTAYSSGEKTIEIAVLGKQYTPEESQTIADKLDSYYGLRNTNLLIRQETNDNGKALKDDILNEISKSKNTLSEKDTLIASLQAIISKNTFNSKELLSEIQILFPKIHKIQFATVDWKDEKSILVGIYESDDYLNEGEVIRLTDWLKIRLGKLSIELYDRNPKPPLFYPMPYGPDSNNGSGSTISNSGNIDIGSQSGSGEVNIE